MLELTIKKDRFLDWYFNYGQDQENTELKVNLANTIISQVYKNGFGCITVKELFDNCNKDSIRAYFTCEYYMLTDYYDLELQDLKEPYIITLI